MSFSTPAVLVLLFPWIALVLWLLSGQRHRVAVPFLELWSGPVTGPKLRRTIQPPPMALACALAALLSAIIGAAGPVIRSRHTKPQMTLIVDRGVAMSSEARRKERQDLSIDASNIVVVPPWDGNWESAPASSIATGELIRAAVAEALANTQDPVGVFSDQNLPQNDPRLIRITPQSTPQNIGIVRVGVATSPKPQLMVRVRNQSSASSADLMTSTSDQTLTQQIKLPSRDAEQNYFIDLPAVGDVIELKLAAADDLAADNTAWLVRQRAWPKVEARSTVSPEVGRMLEVYQKHRPASDGSSRVVVVDNLFSLPTSAPAVAVLRAGTHAQPTSGPVGIAFGNHPVTANVDWREIAQDAVAAESPGDGWQTLVRAGPRVLVAVREQPVHQVWVGFTSPSFPKNKDFVIFWTNVLDWVGQGAETFTSDPTHMVGDEWKLQTTPLAGFDRSPGVYRRSDGAVMAMNALDVRFNPPQPTGWKKQLASVSRSSGVGINLQSTMLLTAIVLMFCATLLWKSRGSAVGVLGAFGSPILGRYVRSRRSL